MIYNIVHSSHRSSVPDGRFNSPALIVFQEHYLIVQTTIITYFNLLQFILFYDNFFQFLKI